MRLPITMLFIEVFPDIETRALLVYEWKVSVSLNLCRRIDLQKHLDQNGHRNQLVLIEGVRRFAYVVKAADEGYPDRLAVVALNVRPNVIEVPTELNPA